MATNIIAFPAPKPQPDPMEAADADLLEAVTTWMELVIQRGLQNGPKTKDDAHAVRFALDSIMEFRRHGASARGLEVSMWRAERLFYARRRATRAVLTKQGKSSTGARIDRREQRMTILPLKSPLAE